MDKQSEAKGCAKIAVKRYTVRDYFERLSTSVENTDYTEVDEKFAVYAINRAINLIVLEPKLDVLFKKHMQMNLTELSPSGERSARWVLNDCGEGDITDIYSIFLFDMSGSRPRKVCLCYKEPDLFWAATPYPELECGEPCNYTLDNEDGDWMFVIDRAIDRPMMLDIRYSSYPKELVSLDDIVPLPVYAMEPVLGFMRSMMYRAQSDFGFSDATDQESDLLITQLKNLVFKRFRASGNRFLGGAVL